MNKSITILSLVVGVIGVLLLFSNPGAGCLSLLVGAVIFITGNRIARQRAEDRKHRELMDAMNKAE